MTAICVIRQRAAVHVIADGAAYDLEGWCRPSPKVWPAPHLPAVFAGRGAMLLVPALAAALASRAVDFDGLRELCGERLRSIAAPIVEMFAARPDAGVFDLIVAGISPRRGPCAFFVCSHDRYPPVTAWRAVDLPDVFALPMSDAIEAALSVEFPGGLKAGELDPLLDGARIIETQAAAFGSTATPIGGPIEVASVESGLISMRLAGGRRRAANRHRSTPF